MNTVARLPLTIWMLLGGMPPPLSLPPLPEDPVMAQVAPAECLWYMSWAGSAEASGTSKNQTEQLLAEEEIQHFAGELERTILLTIRQQTRGREDTVAAAEIPTLIKAALVRPAALFVRDFAVGEHGPDLHGGMIVSAGERAAEIKQSIARLEELAPPNAIKTAGPWHRLQPPGPGAPVFEWGWKGTYLIFGIGAGSADGIVERFSDKPPQWLTGLRKQLVVERPAMVQYLNAKAIIAIAASANKGGRGFDQILSALGIGNLNYFASVSGLEGTGCVTKSQLSFDGPMTGIFDLAGGLPLAAKDLASVPQDATIAFVARIDLDKVYRGALAIADRIQPGARAPVEQIVGQMEQSLGVKLSDDLLQSLGDSWAVYSSPSEGGLLVTGLTAIAPVRDAEKLRKAEEKLLTVAHHALDQPHAEVSGGAPFAGQRGGVSISETKFRSHTIHYLTFIGGGAPIAPAWCITDKELIVSLSPQTIKAHLSRPAGSKSLADVPKVKSHLMADENVKMLSYVDTAPVARMVYPMAQMLYTAAASEAQRHGMNIDAAIFPSAAAILPHLRPAVTTVRAAKSGVLMVSESTLPTGLSPLLLTAVSLYAVRAPRMASPPAAPAAIFFPGAARQAQSIHNLKQIGLAMHGFHDTTNKLPAADGADKNGKPTLSWRVQILPWVEENALYNEFHRDEPWDSEHNKKLIPRMPRTFTAPGSDVAKQFKTVYLTPRAADTMFPAGKQISLTDVTDGTSNTIMVVEASDDRAVIWTKPDDYDVDYLKPMAGLIGLRDNCFLAAMGDGSVRPIRDKMSKETLKALFTRAGGEVISDPNF